MREARAYRFAAPDRTGALLGLSGPQVGGLGLGVIVAVLGGMIGGGLVAMAVPVALASVAAFVRIGGQPLVEAAPPGLRFGWVTLRRQRRWDAPLISPLATKDTPDLPPTLAGQRFLEVDVAAYGLSPTRTGPAVVVVDTRAGSYAATIRASGSEFALVARGEQDSLLARWGVALASFCRERGVVASVRWSEWAAPSGADEQLAYLNSQGHDDPTDPAVVSYTGLLTAAEPLATRHEVLITVTVDIEPGAGSRRPQEGRPRGRLREGPHGPG